MTDRRTLVLLVGMLLASMCAAQRLDMNRLWKQQVDSLSVLEGKPLSVSFRGVNTVNGIWVVNMATEEVIAQAGCRYGQRASITLDPLPPGRYKIGHRGCWTGHSLVLHVLERRPR